jgi:UDP-glucose 4-epimerase
VSTRSGYVVVTGGAGFIGSELVRLLAAEGWRVTVIDNLVNGKEENLEGIAGDRVSLAVEDIRNERRMRELVADAAVVFHLACLGVRHSLHAPRENHDVNASGTLALLTVARDAAVGRFVYVSSSEVYGTARWVPVTEEHPTFPSTVYGASKLAGECYARAFYRSYGYPTVIVRPFNTYGPRCHHEGDSGEVIPKFLLRSLADRPMTIFGDGRQTRDFTYVADTARAIALAGLSEATVGRTINLGSGTELSIGELTRQVAAAAGRSSVRVVHDEPRPGDVLRLCADTTLARELLGFQAAVPLAEGLARLRAWYEAQDASIEELIEDEVVHNWKAERLQPRGA